jgi:hypothetical protein
VQQAPSLVLLYLQARERVQAPAVVARLDDPWVEPQPAVVTLVDQLDLVDVESEIVQLADPPLDPVPLVRPERLLARDGVVEPCVAAVELLGDLDRVERCGVELGWPGSSTPKGPGPFGVAPLWRGAPLVWRPSGVAPPACRLSRLATPWSWSIPACSQRASR